MTDFPIVKFGKWDSYLPELNRDYNNIVNKLVSFLKEVGKDPYQRCFDIEPLLDFTLANGLSNQSSDYIYRHYVYHLLSSAGNPIDIEEEELQHLIDEFILLPNSLGNK